MPRDVNGNYSLPPGNPVIPGTTISTAWANSTLNDIASALTASLSVDGSVTAAKLAANSVTTVKIADLNVTTAKIADLNVTAGKLANALDMTGKTLSNGTYSSITINSGTISGITDLAVADGGTGASTAAGARGNLGAQAQDADLDAIAALGSTGIAVRTAADTWAQRQVVAAAGSNLTVTNPAGVAGDITVDVQLALQGIADTSSGTGFYVRASNDGTTVQRRTITGNASNIQVLNGNGVNGDPSISILGSPTISGIITTGGVRSNVGMANMLTPTAYVLYAQSAMTGTYNNNATTIFVTINDHNLKPGSAVQLDFTSGTAVDGSYIVNTVSSKNTFEIASAQAITSGNVTKVYSLNDEYNTAGFSDDGVGLATITFDTDMTDYAYLVELGHLRQINSGTVGLGRIPLSNKELVSCQVLTLDAGSTAIDSNHVSVMFSGGR